MVLLWSGLLGILCGHAWSMSPSYQGNRQNSQEVDTCAHVPLVVYFSWSGNSRQIASEIAQLSGGILLEVQAQEAYPTDYRATVERSKKEKAQIDSLNLYPSIVIDSARWTQLQSLLLSRCCTGVYLCYPVWLGRMAMPMQTFLHQYHDMFDEHVPWVAVVSTKRSDGEKTRRDIEKFDMNRNLQGLITIYSTEMTGVAEVVKKRLAEDALFRLWN